jgi:putative aldouronate transport system substrate-binding protein
MLVLMMTLALIPLSGAAAAETDDITGHKYEAVMRKWIAKGWMAGTGAPGVYKPDQGVTRADFAVFFNHFAGLTEESPDIGKYADVTGWQVLHMSRALQAGYYKGDGVNLMPTQPIPQEQALTSVESQGFFPATEDLGILDALTNEDAVSDWARPHVAAALRACFALVANGELLAQDGLTRAETVFLLDCVLNDVQTFGFSTEYTGGSVGGAVIAADGVTLTDTAIAGDLVIDEAVGDGDVWLDGLTVGGKLDVRGGGLESVHVKGSKVAELIVTKDAVRVVYEDGTEVTESRTVGEGSTVVIQNGARVDKITVESDAVGAIVTVESGARVTDIEVSAPETEVLLLHGARVETVAVAETATAVSVDLESGARIGTLNMLNDTVVTGEGDIDTITITEVGGPSPSPTATVAPTAPPQTDPPPPPPTEPPPPPDIYYTVTWNADGGTPSPTLTSVIEGGSIAQPTAMTKEGFDFGGWYTDAAFTTAAVFPVTGVAADMAFYAKWTPTPPDPDDLTETVTLNLSVFYNRDRMQFVEGEPWLPYNAADGEEYVAGDFKPVWAELQERLNFTIVDAVPVGAGDTHQAMAALETADFEGVDIVNGPITDFAQFGQEGHFVDLTEYLDIMPNFSNFLEDNSIVETSITSGDGAIYYTPYFDGYDEIERMFIFRADWVRQLLDEDGPFDTAREVDTYYEPYIEAPYDFTVEAVTADGSGTQTIRKQASVNVITTQNELQTKDGANLVQALRDHIDTVYAGVYANRSDLFIGQDAAYDADEMVALFRCVLANTTTLTGQSDRLAVPFYPRWYQMGRVVDLLGLSMAFGVRGTESKMGYLYLDESGDMQDARLDIEFYDFIERLNWMYKEGLILEDFDTQGATGGLGGNDHRARLNNANLGFATYDYNQTTTALNDTVSVSGFELRPVITPYAEWEDGEWYPFSSSWRSVKGDGWGIVKSVETEAEATGDPTKLYRALKLLDYLYSSEGNTLMSYGPDAWIDGTIEYGGKTVPKLSDDALAEFDTPFTGGNYTNYYRQYLGGMFPIGFVKEQGMEYQTTHPAGQLGIEIINNAVRLGTMRHLRVDSGVTAPQDKSMPSTFWLTEGDYETLNSETTAFQNAWIASNTDEARMIVVDYIKYGFGEMTGNGDTLLTKEGLISDMIDKGGDTYLLVYSDAYERMPQ